MNPELLNCLQEGASEADFEDLERLLSVRLPEDFKAFYSIHNGQVADGPWLMAGEELLSLARIKDEWQVWKDLLDDGAFTDDLGVATEGIRNEWWHPLWIPITYDGGGNHCCLDLAPTDKGTYGQIIRMWHDDPERPLVASSFTAWITAYTDQLLNGELVYSDTHSAILYKDDL